VGGSGSGEVGARPSPAAWAIAAEAGRTGASGAGVPLPLLWLRLLLWAALGSGEGLSSAGKPPKPGGLSGGERPAAPPPAAKALGGAAGGSGRCRVPENTSSPAPTKWPLPRLQRLPPLSPPLAACATAAGGVAARPCAHAAASAPRSTAVGGS
jgi:hypothetical protein